MPPQLLPQAQPQSPLHEQPLQVSQLYAPPELFQWTGPMAPPQETPLSDSSVYPLRVTQAERQRYQETVQRQEREFEIIRSRREVEDLSLIHI